MVLPFVNLVLPNPSTIYTAVQVPKRSFLAGIIVSYWQNERKCPKFIIELHEIGYIVF